MNNDYLRFLIYSGKTIDELEFELNKRNVVLGAFEQIYENKKNKDIKKKIKDIKKDIKYINHEICYIKYNNIVNQINEIILLELNQLQTDNENYYYISLNITRSGNLQFYLDIYNDMGEKLTKQISLKQMEVNFNFSIESINKIKILLGKNLSEISNNNISSPSYRFDILKRDNYTCQLCGKTAQDGVKLEIDHKIPRSKGGSNHPSNLWVLCFDCNRGKSAKDL